MSCRSGYQAKLTHPALCYVCACNVPVCRKQHVTELVMTTVLLTLRCLPVPTRPSGRPPAEVEPLATAVAEAAATAAL